MSNGYNYYSMNHEVDEIKVMQPGSERNLVSMEEFEKRVNNKRKERDNIKSKILNKIEFFDWFKTNKRSFNIKNEMYDEIKNCIDIEHCIRSHIYECGKKGKYYRELLEYYKQLIDDE